MDRRQKIRYALVVAIVVVSAVVVATGVFYQRADKLKDIMAGVKMSADASLGNFSYTETVAGKKRWTLSAVSASHDLDSKDTLLKQVTMQLYDYGDFGDVVLTGDEGQANMDSGQVEVRGHVVITTASGYRFTSNSLHYSRGGAAAGGVITTADPVHITSAEMDITGVGMRIDLARSTWHINNNVAVKYTPSSGG